MNAETMVIGRSTNVQIDRRCWFKVEGSQLMNYTHEMTALEIKINHQNMCIAGLSSPGVLTTILTLVRQDHEELNFEVAGLDSNSNQHMKWLENHELNIGDEIQIRIVESAKPDRPGSRRNDDPEAVRRSKEECVRRYADDLGWKILESGSL
jgi:hypothetical protein